MSQGQLKLPHLIVRLEGAFLPVFSDPHECYVEYQTESSPQGCLVVREQNGEEIWDYALIVLPSDAPVSTEFRDPAYTVALGLINSAYKAVLNRPFAEAMLALRERTWEEWPFCDNSRDSLIHDIRSFIADPTTDHLSALDITKKIEDLCEQHQFGRNAWMPIVLNCNRFPYKREIKWEIARAWKNHNLGDCTRDGCARKLGELGLYDGGFSDAEKNTLGRSLARLGLHTKYHVNQRH